MLFTEENDIQNNQEMSTERQLEKKTTTQKELPAVEECEFFKWSNPVYIQELDWGITLSKYEFPWREIAF